MRGGTSPGLTLAWATTSEVCGFAHRILLAGALVLPALTGYADSVYETNAQFLDRAFDGNPPDARVLWLSGEVKAGVRERLGHDYPALRLRYWCRAARSAWILEEIGKELPITVGLIVEAGRIESLRVLVYRENRGGEVARATFSDQFNGAGPGRQRGLDTGIDGITGATLSVQALTRLAGVGLYLHTKTACANGA
ncbi:MAG: FMN-binding protein [Xanthomonadales bacterium]|nr:FMN-binding protein [Xanthomonadales bacterium]